MNQLITYNPDAVQQRPVQTSGALDSWVSVMSDVIRLSEYICQTEFVPEALRNKPAACAAAMLTGREMGIEPMTALRHIHVVKGKPGLSAELMRAQVLAAGHEIRYVESSDTRCVVEGRRRGQSEWTRATFTSQQAAKASIDLRGYPEDKLIARATSRLCRRIFPDVVAGLASVDELEDGVHGDAEAETTKSTPAKRTAQRTTKATASVQRPAPQPQPQPQQEEPAPAEGPPLPGEDGYDEPVAEPEQSDAEPAAEEITAAQQNKIGALMREHGITDRKGALGFVTDVIGREVGSRKELTKVEASKVIDALEREGDSSEGEQEWADEGATGEDDA